MAATDDVIGAWIKRVEQTGELKHGKLWGKPFEPDDGFEQTPQELRMAQKILKNAGFLPWEVEAKKRIAGLQAALATATEESARLELQRQLAELQQQLAVRMERRRS